MYRQNTSFKSLLEINIFLIYCENILLSIFSFQGYQLIRQVFCVISDWLLLKINFVKRKIADMHNISASHNTIFGVKSVDWKLLLTIWITAHMGQSLPQQSWWISCADKKEKTKTDAKIKALIIIATILFLILKLNIFSNIKKPYFWKLLNIILKTKLLCQNK